MADEEKKAAEGGKSAGGIAKVVAAVFGTVLAPVLVAVGIKWADPSVWKSNPPATTATAPQPTTPTPPKPTTKGPATLKKPPQFKGKATSKDHAHTP
jgi:hypothetical protein